MSNIEATSTATNIAATASNTVVNTNKVNNIVDQNKRVQDTNTTVTETKATKAINLDEVVNKINKALTSVPKNINFSIDENSGRKVISVYEKGSDKLIRQLPSEDALKLLDNLEQLKGLLFNSKV
ncbi:MAG: flagellar protein FlaG [Alteromonadaceae bacterium]|nr:flagellar protein FlaG [Alteromonadaceae bacterium]